MHDDRQPSRHSDDCERLGFAPSLKVKLSSVLTKFLAPVMATKRSPPRWSRMVLATVMSVIFRCFLDRGSLQQPRGFNRLAEQKKAMAFPATIAWMANPNKNSSMVKGTSRGTFTRGPLYPPPIGRAALRGSVRLRITHTRQTRTDNIGERPRALLSRGLMTRKRSVLLSLEPIMRPRLYNIAHRIAWRRCWE